MSSLAGLTPWQIGTDPGAQVQPLPALHLRLRTSQLIRATQTLRDTAHELKLMLLLSDELDIARRRDEEVRAVRREVQRARQDVVRGFVRLVAADGEGGHDDEGREPDRAGMGDVAGRSQDRPGAGGMQVEGVPGGDGRRPETTEPRDIPLPPSSSPEGPQRPADSAQPGDMSPSQTQADDPTQAAGMDVDGQRDGDGGEDDDDDMEEV